MPTGIFAAVAKQTQFDTPVARTRFFRVRDDSRCDHKRSGEPRAALGLADPERIHYATESGDWLLSPEPCYEGLLTLIEAAMGQGSHSVTGTGPYDHTFVLKDTLDPAGLSVELAKKLLPLASASKLATGAIVNEMTVEATAGEELNISFGGPSRKVDLVTETASPVYPDYDTDTITVDQIAVEVDSVATEVDSISFTLNNNQQTDRAKLGDRYIKAPKRAGKREITGELVKDWEDATLYNKWLNGSAATITITCTSAGGKNLVFIFPNVLLLGDMTEDLTEAEVIPQTVPYRAMHDATDGALKITARNNEATV